ncbi:hypothetical protein [Nocardia cyriacigeorgica]|uniref:hypothetical protein n=1 Tax=Nocardia cyriacigeorgica TaxID=135487 RepID=UPI0018939B07|nr:hypothetical protein [Nocardia cyriacigeorgica]MBF6085358.1 hypothetical protein [Nocardia cyriacigeorgica]MBF6091445.1 hypothetical protein [Nocardia cyriacigeorgica]
MARIARLFDGPDKTGLPDFSTRRIVQDEDERSKIKQFLTGGVLILRTSGRSADALAPEKKRAVPMSYATDGVWIWSRAAAYYLDNHGIAPEEDFLAHILRCNYSASVPDQDAVNSAIEDLKQHFSASQNRS